MQYALSAALVGFLAWPPALSAQTKPDFSGTWIMDASRSASAVSNEPVKSMTVVIRQSPAEINIETKRDETAPRTLTYKPGAPGSLTNTVAGRTGLLAAIWYWQDDTLITETLSDVNGMTVRTKANYALQPGGSEMTIESVLVVEHGYTLKGGKNYGATTDTFKKAAP